MTWAFTVESAGKIYTLASNRDWFAVHAEVLACMGIVDAGPVLTRADAEQVAKDSIARRTGRKRKG